jgi:phosphate transport system protein
MSEMGEMAIECIDLAISSYLEGKNTTDAVHKLSDKIRMRYYEVADLIFEIMLKYQPVADDFRFIRSSTEISYAFSRFGRYAYDITQIRDKFGDISGCDTKWVSDVSKEVRQMIKDAISSFTQLDIRKAIKIQEEEAFVDKVYQNRIPMLLESKNTKCALAEALLLRYLERIADHAVFMSDAVNYIVTGKHKLTSSQIKSNSTNLS